MLSSSIWGQESLQKKLQSSPKIDSLLSYVRLLDSEPREVYEFNGDYKRTLDWNFWESIQPQRNSTTHLLIDSIRQTFMELADQALENYMEERHHDGMDSLVYIITLGKNENRKKNMDTQLHEMVHHGLRSTAISTPNTSESMIFSYRPIIDEQGAEPEGYNGMFFYNNVKAGGDSIKPVFIDLKAYEKMMKKIFNRKGIHQQHCHIRKDSTYVFDHIHEHWSIGEIHSDHEWASEGKATIYTFSSDTLAMEVYRILKQHTWQFIEEHPTTRCTFQTDSVPRSFPFTIFKSETKLKDNLSHKFIIYLSMDWKNLNTHAYHIVVFDVRMSEWGTEFLPRDWQSLKSWKNGKRTYYKKKQ